MANVALAFEILAKDKASKVFEKAADAADDMQDSVSKSSAHLGRVGESADNAETRIMGLKDSVDGLGGIMQGPGEQGIAAYLQGWADFASGVANFVVPAFQKIFAGGLTQIRQAAQTAAATAVSVAKQIASWVVLGVQSTLQAGKVAAAWLISMGPIILVGAAVAGLVYLVVKHWDTIRNAIATASKFIVDKVQAAFGWVKGAVSDALGFVTNLFLNFTGPGLLIKHFDDIVGFVTKMPGRITKAASGMWDGIKGAFKSAINFIIRGWNKLEFKVPGFKVGPVKFGGFTLGMPDIPEFHSGGRITSSLPRFPGDGLNERTIRARVGETVVPNGGGPLIDVGGITLAGPANYKSARDIIFELRALAVSLG